MVELDQSWRLSGSVALRPEPFGALAYDFHTRHLTFLKTPLLVRLVRALDGVTVQGAMEQVDVAPAERAMYLTALRRLAAAGILESRGTP